MTIKELQKQLKTLSDDMEVKILHDKEYKSCDLIVHSSRKLDRADYILLYPSNTEL